MQRDHQPLFFLAKSNALAASGLFLLACLPLVGCQDSDDASNRAASPSSAPSARPSDATSTASVELPKLDEVATKVRRDGNGRIIEVDFRGATIGNDALRDLATLKNIKVLKLNASDGACDVDDQGVAMIGKVGSLKVVALDGLPIHSSAIKSLVGLTELKELYLASTEIDDTAFDSIASFSKLEKLRVAKTPISDKAFDRFGMDVQLTSLDVSECVNLSDQFLKSLRNQKSLQRLNLYSVPITDAGMGDLTELSNLNWLNVDNTSLTNDSLGIIGQLSKLTFLHLGLTKISDEGLPQLAKLKNLEKLIVTRTDVTEAGVAELQKELPETEIQRVYVPGK